MPNDYHPLSEVLEDTVRERQGVQGRGRHGLWRGPGALRLGFLLSTCVYALETALARWLSALIIAVLVGGRTGQSRAETHEAGRSPYRQKNSNRQEAYRMGEKSSQIARQIEQTRAELGSR